MLEYERYLDAEQANYHFTLADLVEFIELYGWDQVVSDLKDYYDAKVYYETQTRK